MLPEPATPLAPEFRFAAMDLGDAVQREAAVALQCASNDSGFEPEHYRRHRERQMARYAAMLAAGLGGWSGIWRGDQLLADCGLFRRAAPGRFRHVGTPAAWRRRGLCSALIHGVTRHGLDEIGLQRLIMYGDPYDVTIGIHETVGYRREGRYWGATGARRADPRGMCDLRDRVPVSGFLPSSEWLVCRQAGLYDVGLTSRRTMTKLLDRTRPRTRRAAGVRARADARVNGSLRASV